MSSTTGSVTLADVAKIAGVAPATVSRALNYPEKVAPKTLERINDAINKIGYVPNMIAGALATRRSRLIAAIIPSIANTVYSETIQYFSKTLRDSGYQVLLGETEYFERQEESIVRAVLGQMVDGIFLTGTKHTPVCQRMLLSANIPIVEIWDLTLSPIDMNIGFSHEHIGQATAEFLLSKGYRRFSGIWGEDSRAQIRRKAFVETLRKNERTVEFIQESTVPTSYEKGRSGMAKILKEGFINGAIVCSSDTTAHGVLSEARFQGLSIPDQIAIVGLGDDGNAAHTSPSLTSVRLDKKAMGKGAAELLLDKIHGKTIKEHIIDVGFRIVERGST